MRKAIYTIIMLALVLSPVVAAVAASAPTAPIEGTPIRLSDIEVLISDVLNFIITVAGLIVTGYFLYAGYTMLSAGDDTAKFTKGKTMLRNAIYGALVVFGVGVILNTIADFASNPTQIF